MTQNQPVRVKGGLPWWLWAMLVVATIVIGTGVIISSAPVDPDEVFQTALKSFDAHDQPAFNKALATLKKTEGYESHLALLLGMQASVQNRDPLALDYYNEAIKHDDVKPLALQKRGAVLTKLGDYKEAIAGYEEAIGLAPDTENLSRVLLARLYYAVGALQLAEKTLDVVKASEPENKDARGMLAQIKLDQNRYADALEEYLAILSSPGAFSSASPALMSGYTRCIVKLKDKERLRVVSDEHIALLEDMALKTAVQIELDDIERFRKIVIDGASTETSAVDTKVAAARIEFAAGDLRNAEKFLNQCLEILPREIDVMELAVKLYAKNNQPEKLAIAQQNLDKLLDIEGQRIALLKEMGDNIDNARQRFDLAKISIDLGKFPDGQKWFGVAVAIDPSIAQECATAAEEAYKNYGLHIPFTKPEETKPEETKPEETKPEESKPEEPKPEEPKPEEPKPEEPKPEEPKPEEPKPEEPKPEEPKPEEPKPEEPKPEEPKPEEPKPEEPKPEEPKPEEPKPEEPKPEEPKPEEPKPEEPRPEEPKPEEPKPEEPKPAE